MRWKLTWCESCGRPVDANSFPVAPGRKLCSTCVEEAIWCSRQVQDLDLLTRARHLVAWTVGIRVGPVSVLVVPSGVLAPRCSGSWLADRREIWLRVGLSRRYALAVLAHELAHAWRTDRGVDVWYSELEEGWAMWVEYHVLLAMGDEWGARSIGRLSLFQKGSRGFRALRGLEARQGKAAVVAFAGSHAALDALDEVLHQLSLSVAA
jgi:hypothetical protein